MSIKPVFVSTYPPRECGIATFTQDLVNAIEKYNDVKYCYVIALSKDKHIYDNRVLYDINQDKFSNYVKAVNLINMSDIDVVVIEHEYGIFGGEDGDYIVPFVKLIRKPIITTFHTVLKNPTAKQFEILKKLADASYKVITMAKTTKEILMDVYDVEEEKIEVVHHGVPYMELEDKEILKKKYNLDGKKVISTFGLISPGKGLEYAIQAMDRVRKEFEDAVYLILGQTHPNIKRIKGEEYRDKLVNMVRELKLEDNVVFVDKYLTKREIMEYLRLSDIYLTPYIGREQAVSGTLAYAIGSGKAIVSTPYTYAQEMLSDGRGMLVEFEDAYSIADAIITLLKDENLRKEIERRTAEVGKEMYWHNVAKRMIDIFYDVVELNKKVGVIA
ncbi:glycosyltransferase family 4 protein [Caldicellulosiruptor morganii]|uniref:Glycosyltransferase family 4 protein n=1 Tax=Caldicellulosiruptor morganii TaxID=1387555 RepID=A0ABY7BL38_9FIRM|nr:glycosyltransferase family 4 protein [Caldicellulosiruptor morganii]WAM33007.1 glycosyltransferase family 4 protein [Caldicellulosiruptor morganii]